MSRRALLASAAHPALLIAARNLRAAAFARGPIALRCAVAAMFLLALGFAANERAQRAAPGLVLLHWFGNANLWLIALCGIALFPGLIVEEREQRTWSLLRLAGIGPTGFLLGQSLSALVLMLFVIAVQVPFLLLAVALGGTSARIVATTVLVLVVHALMVYGLALLASARAPTVRAATVRAVFLVSLATIVPTHIGLLLPSAVGVLVAWSPCHASNVIAALRAGTATDADIAGCLGGQSAIAAVAIAGAWLMFDAREDRGNAAVRRRWRRPAHRFAPGVAAVRDLAQRFVTGGPRTWTVLGALYIAVVVLVAPARQPFGTRMFEFFMLQGLILVALAAVLGAWSMRAHVLARTVPLLALTQPDTAAWLWGVRRARWKTIVVFALSLVVTWTLSTKIHASEMTSFLVMVMAGAVMADALGELCGLVVSVAPWAVSLLASVGAGALMLAGGYALRPRVEPYFLGHAVAYGAIAIILWQRTTRLLRSAAGAK